MKLSPFIVRRHDPASFEDACSATAGSIRFALDAGRDPGGEPELALGNACVDFAVSLARRENEGDLRRRQKRLADGHRKADRRARRILQDLADSLGAVLEPDPREQPPVQTVAQRARSIVGGRDLILFAALRRLILDRLSSPADPACRFRGPRPRKGSGPSPLTWFARDLRHVDVNGKALGDRRIALVFVAHDIDPAIRHPTFGYCLAAMKARVAKIRSRLPAREAEHRNRYTVTLDALAEKIQGDVDEERRQAWLEEHDPPDLLDPDDD